MPVPKPVLSGSMLTVYPTDAEGIVSYFLDLEGTGYVLTPDVLNQALIYLPKIGDYKDFSNVTGAPRATLSSSLFNVSTHDMRVWNLRTKTLNNVNKHSIEVVYKSRPQPSIEFGSSASQQATETYRLPTGGDRSQMTLSWLAKKDAFGTGSPPRDLPLPKTPFTGTAFVFGSTVRVSSTFYSNELDQVELQLLQNTYTTTINRDTFFSQNSSILQPDNRLWLCSSINQVSNDGGYSMRVSVEWIFNPNGWDTVGVYRYNNGPAILTPEVTAGLFTNLTLEPIPAPYLPTQGGAGRWPQQYAIPMTPLLGWISQGILAPNANVVDVVTQR